MKKLNLLLFALSFGCFLPFLGFSTNVSNPSKGGKTSVQLVSTSDKAIELVFSLQGYQSETVKLPNAEASVIRLENGSRILEAGAPDLNKLTASVIIPATEKMNIEIVSAKYYDVENVLVAPSKGNLYRNQNPYEVPYFFGPSYTEDAFYPGNLAELRSPYILRDFRGQTVVAYPLQYNPVTKVLRVYTFIQVKLVNTGEKGENILTVGNPKKIGSEFDQIYRHQFLNYSTPKYTPIEETGKMLIVCPAKYLEAIKPFSEWKNKRGISTETIVYSAATTGTTANALFAYVQNYYQQNGLTFLLLVGDAEDIPSLYASGDSDVAYSYMAGNDSYPEFFVGRLSASNVGHVQTQVEKAIVYERDLDGTATWLSNGMGIASAEGGGGIGDDGESDKQHMEKIKEALLGFTYQNITSVYDPGATATQVANAINAGVSNINYVGHGADTYWVTSGFGVSDCNNLTNKDRWPFVFDIACVNGNFHGQTCFAEAFMQASDDNKPTGAVTIIASTINQSWDPPMDGQDEMVDILVESYENNIKRTFGGIAYNGCLHMNDEYGSGGDEMTDTWTTFGDPSLLVRTAAPVAMEVSHPEELLIGMPSLEVTCNTEGALACISHQGIIVAASAVINGTALLEFEPFTDIADLDMVITAFNKITYQNVIKIIPAEGPYLSLVKTQINDKFGNNNGCLDNKEDAFVEVQIKNVGVEASGNVVARLSCSDAFIQIANATHNYGTIEAGSLAGNSSFSIHVSENASNQHAVTFLITFTDSLENSWTREMSFTIHAPVLNFDKAVLTEDGSIGDGNGKLEPGESAIISLDVFNLGTNVSDPFQMKWEVESPYVLLENESTTVSSIEAGMSTTITLKVSAHISTPQGTKVLIKYWHESIDSLQKQVQVVVGQTPVLELGNQTTKKYNYPFYNYYKSNKTQIIYHASEFSSGSHLVSEIALDLASITNNALHRQLKNFVLKLGTTSASEIENSYLTLENSDTVLFSENLELPAIEGWFTMDIDPYEYQTSYGNLVVEIYWGINDTYCASTDRSSVYCSETDLSTVAFGYADTEYPANFDGANKTRPNIRFGFIDQNLIQDTLTIEVFDATLMPVPGAEVKIGSQTLLTDTLGVVHYYLSHGEYRVNLSKDLHQPIETKILLNDTSKWVTLTLPVYANLFQAQFFVSEGASPVEGALVTLNQQLLTTNPNGVVLFEQIPPGIYTFSVTKEGFTSFSQELVVAENVSIPVSLSHIEVYSVTFEVSEYDLPLENVNVLFNNQWIVTQSNGKAVFTNIPSGATLNYYIEKWGYYSFTHTIEEISQNLTVTILMNAIPDLLVHVTHKFGNMEKAKVTFQNQSGYTNSDGMAKFDDVATGENQPVRIECQGYYADTMQIGIADQNQTLESYLFKKSDLKIQVSDGNHVIEGAVVSLGTLEKSTNSEGNVEFLANTEATDISLSVTYPGYYPIETKVSFVKDVDLDTLIIIEMIPDLEFTISSKGATIEGALLTISGMNLVSDSEGKIKITDLIKGTYAYTLDKVGYYTIEQDVVIESTDVAEAVELYAIPDVNFTITHNGIPESGVSVEVGTKKIITSATGKSLFIDLPADIYNYTVSKEGFDTLTGEITVTDENLEIPLDVRLVSAATIDASSIQIYPNPSHGELIIELPSNIGLTKIDIFNGLGLLVFTQNNLGRLTTVDLTNFKKGMYFISLSGENRKIQYKHICE